MSGFPAVRELNALRYDLFYEQNNSRNEILERVAYFVGHKVLSVCALPANLAVVGIGMAGMATASILGAFKVAVFTVTLGHVKPYFNTGLGWFFSNTIDSLEEIASIQAEIVVSGLVVVCEGVVNTYDLAEWIVEKLNLTDAVRSVAEKIEVVLDRVFWAINRGFYRAYRSESRYDYSRDKFPFYIIDQPIKDSSSDICSLDRSWKQIFNHTSASMVNIPLNAAITGVAMPMVLISAVAFVAKAIFNVITDSDLQVPVFFEQVFSIYSHSLETAVVDAAVCISDVFLATCKIFDAVGLSQPVIRTFKILEYVPEAIFDIT